MPGRWGNAYRIELDVSTARALMPRRWPLGASGGGSTMRKSVVGQRRVLSLPPMGSGFVAFSGVMRGPTWENLTYLA